MEEFGDGIFSVVNVEAAMGITDEGGTEVGHSIDASNVPIF